MSDTQFVTYFTPGVIEDRTGVLPIFTATHLFSSSDTVITETFTLVPAIARKQIRVVSLFISSPVQVEASFVQFRSNTTPITANIILNLLDNKIFQFNPIGWFDTQIGEALVSVINTFQFSKVSLSLRYLYFEQ